MIWSSTRILPACREKRVFNENIHDKKGEIFYVEYSRSGSGQASFFSIP